MVVRIRLERVVHLRRGLFHAVLDRVRGVLALVSIAAVGGGVRIVVVGCGALLGLGGLELRANVALGEGHDALLRGVPRADAEVRAVARAALAVVHRAGLAVEEDEDVVHDDALHREGAVMRLVVGGTRAARVVVRVVIGVVGRGTRGETLALLAATRFLGGARGRLLGAKAISLGTARRGGGAGGGGGGGTRGRGGVAVSVAAGLGRGLRVGVVEPVEVEVVAHRDERGTTPRRRRARVSGHLRATRIVDWHLRGGNDETCFARRLV